VAKAKHHHQLPALGILTKGNYAGTDQGVDFRGAGNVPAIGAGVVTDVGITHIIETGNKIWHYVIYRITSGPLKGQFVYVAENIKPTVKVGQRVSFGQTVAHALGSYPYIETGFNKTAKGWNAFGTLNGPQPQGAAMWKYLLQLGSNRTTRVKVNGKWYRIRNGHWVGKGPPNYHGASYLGELAHYAIHPGQGVTVTAGAVGGIADSALKRVLYAVVMVGGFLLVLTGMAMIGLDLTLGRNATARKVVSAAGLGGIAAARMNRRAERPPSDKEQMSAYRRGERQGTLQGARREGARVARSRIATPQNLKPKPKYSGKEDSGNVPF
jgi:hypothetical protein